MTARLAITVSGLASLTGLGVAFGHVGPWAMVPAALLPTLCLLAQLAILRRDARNAAARITTLSSVTDTPAAGTTDDDPPTLLTPITDAAYRLARVLREREQAERRRQRGEAAILDRLPDPLVILDGSGEVTRQNQAARQSFGADLPAVLRHPALRSSVEQALTGMRPADVEISLAVPVPREVLATLLPLEAALFPRERVAVVLSDRSRDKAVERMRADFVANVSHELRTPLTTLVGFTETLLGPAADDAPAREQFLRIMADQGRRMSRLIDDLLSLSRIELVEHQPPVELVDLPQLVDRVLTFYGPRRSRIDAAMEPDLPTVAGDADQLVQVLQNLLDNAIKYGRDEGMVRLSIARSMAGTEWPPGGLVMSVADDGPGIAAEHIPRLTERFYRVDKARSQSAGGTGLGLAIVKHIVNRHRGVLRIYSTEGVGTTVSVWLPVASAATSAVVAE